MFESNPKDKKLTVIIQPQEYFLHLITRVMEQNGIKAFPETTFYLVNILNKFMKTEQLFPSDPAKPKGSETLALMVKEALETEALSSRNEMFRHIGDVSLYVAGYFQESLSRKVVDVDYYIEMGGIAYQSVANIEAEEVLKNTFLELARKFSSFVDVLSEVSEQTCPRSEKDILRMYELWVKTRSERLAKTLQDAGILPNSTIKKQWQ